ncbi:uncharacterized protein septin12 isoform X2 [Syngnathoides biaculeatus]|uniref:uncharacterized protein septin12 isoform X2 n=1 Tax=Syngnathoides biaculeatus TaxID=300417 RepID=UPI002ADD75F2|nr:uncharacterized protein septin12 isoform X2 [Syngnathoides biaculeatus]
MSALSVNDHLEGILSDFEALKRSFDIEDVDDIPSFSSASATSSPVSPSSSHYFNSPNKANECRSGGESPSSLQNINNLVSAGYQTCINQSSNPSPVLRSRTVVSSLSFNRGTINKPGGYNNNSSVARAASFQSRVKPNNGFSILRGPGSDNDSLHSSSSSLEYSGVGGGSHQPNKLTPYPSPPPLSEYHQAQPQLSEQQQHPRAKLGNNHNLTKLSSHGTIFQSALDQGIGLVLGSPDLHGINHGTLPSLDVQICDGTGGILGVQRGGDQVSPGLRYINTNVTYNGHLKKANSLEVEGSCGPNNHRSGLQTTQANAKETLHLSKFPLDLDSWVTTTSTSSPAKVLKRPISPNPPKPPPRSTRSLHHTNSPYTPASLSASLSSFDSCYNSSPLSRHHPLMAFSSHSTAGSIPVADVSCSPVPLSPAETLHLGTLSRSQVVQVNPIPPNSSSASSPRAISSLEDCPNDVGDSLCSILERIASFSRPVITNTTPAPVILRSTLLKNGVPSSKLGCPSETTLTQTRGCGQKRDKESAGDLNAEVPSLMEEREEKESSIMGEEDAAEDKCEAILVSTVPPNSVMETKTNGKEVHVEEKEMEKGMEEGDMKKEVGSEVNVEVCQTVPDLQMSFIHGSDLFGYVGIEAVLDQMRHKTMKAGFEFNIMVVGQSGLGKSTMVNTLFKSKVSRKSCTQNHAEKISSTVKLQSVSHMIEEKGVKMKLTVIDTPGFGDQINNDNCWDPIVKYINEQYEKYLREELHVNRKRRIPDTRVHCCIYFLAATGHRLRPIDIEFMKRLGKIVSIVPVIAKADTLTIEEREEFKQRKEYDEDPEECILNDRIRESIPFAVVGTDKEHQVNGNKVLGRKTKWGIIEVENVAHCEFANLRDLLIRSHLQDLKDVTHNIHYETYRVQRLNECNINFIEQGLSTWPLENGTPDKYESDSHL